MHIAMAIGSMDPHKGGPPQVVAGSAASLARRGHIVTIFTTKPTFNLDYWAAYFSGLSVTVLSYPVDFPLFLGRSIKMKTEFSIQCEGFDVLHIHGVWEGHLAQLAQEMRKAGKPVVLSSHGMLDRWSMCQSAWKKRLALAFGSTGRMLYEADAVIFGSSSESLESRKTISEKRHVIIPNGIDTSSIASFTDGPDTNALIARFPIIQTWRRTILYFSRIHPKKGLDILVAAFAHNKHRLEGVGLLVVGIPQDDEYLESIKRTIASSNLSRHIVITTDLVGAEARSAFGVSDVFALPSHQEGFSVAIIEAMAAGKPVLITDKCHMGEVSEWNAGVVVPNTAQGVAEGLGQIIDINDNELVEMGRNARSIAKERFDWANISGQLERLYLKLIAAK